MQNRKNEQGKKTFFRGSRCFSADGRWYIATREGANIGPFDSRKLALSAIPIYMRSMTDRKSADTFTRKIAKEGVWASSFYR
jgi:hypothetical protein